MAIYFPDGDGGRMTISSGDDVSLPTASASVKGGVMIGGGLAMDGDTLNVSLAGADIPVASTSVRGGIKLGTGLLMDGDRMHVTVQGGGISTAFTGATQYTSGAIGAVPAPRAGDQNKVLRGNGEWAALTTTVTIGTTPSTVDGAVWFSI